MDQRLQHHRRGRRRRCAAAAASAAAAQRARDRRCPRKRHSRHTHGLQVLPKTPTPKPQTQNPNPQTPNPKPQTPTPPLPPCCRYSDSDCSAGLILGTGTNIAYTARARSVADLKATDDVMVINTEWGEGGGGGVCVCQCSCLVLSSPTHFERQCVHPQHCLLSLLCLPFIPSSPFDCSRAGAYDGEIAAAGYSLLPRYRIPKIITKFWFSRLPLSPPGPSLMSL